MKFRELFEDRVEQGPIDNAAFAAMLAKVAAEFETQSKKRRRRGRGRSVAPVKPVAYVDIPRSYLMFITSRNVWHPLGRKPTVGAPPSEPLEPAELLLDADDLPEPAEFNEDPDPNAWDEADELAAMPNEDFYQSLRQDISGVREGTVPSIHDTEHKVRQMRPWSKKRQPRDRYGNRLY